MVVFVESREGRGGAGGREARLLQYASFKDAMLKDEILKDAILKTCNCFVYKDASLKLRRIIRLCTSDA